MDLEAWSLELAAWSLELAAWSFELKLEAWSLDLEAGSGFVESGNSPNLASAKGMSNFFFENACFDHIFGSERVGAHELDFGSGVRAKVES